MMKKVKLEIEYQDDRERMILALANSGYKCWVEEKSNTFKTIYYVIFEIKN